MTPADDQRGCATPAVISHRFWQREYGGRPDAIGSTLTLDGLRVEVIGISKAGFNGIEVGRGFDIAVPICSEPAFSSGEGRLASGTDWWLIVMGRLQPGWTIDAASEHLATISPALFGATIAPNYPAASVAQYRAFTLRATAGALGASGLRGSLPDAAAAPARHRRNRADHRVRQPREPPARTRERACARVLRPPRAWRVARTDRPSAPGGKHAARVNRRRLRSIPGRLPEPVARRLFDQGEQQVLLDLGFDVRVLAFTAGTAVLTCLLFGLAPAIRATRAGSDGLLRGAGRGLTASPSDSSCAVVS